jgi:hypothetical protein
VPAVGGGDLCDAQALRRGDDGGVDGAEREVVVTGDELGDPERIGGVDRLERQAARGEIAEETDLGVPAEAGGDQVGDLGDDQGGDDERSRMGLEQCEAYGVVVVVSVDVGVERTGVDDQRDGSVSARRISSMRAETSPRPLRPAPAAPRRRRFSAPRSAASASRVTSAIVTPRRCASWRSRASRSSESFTVVRRIGVPTYQGTGPAHGACPITSTAARSPPTTAYRRDRGPLYASGSPAALSATGTGAADLPEASGWQPSFAAGASGTEQARRVRTYRVA